MYGRRACDSLARAAEILAICMRDCAPSCMRAPPEHDTMMSGVCCCSARSAARVIFSPTTEPLLPPMKPYSMTANTTAMPPTVPSAVITASLSPVRSW